MELNRRQLHTIQTFLRTNVFRTPINQCWHAIIEQWGIGRIEGKEYCVTRDEKHALRRQCKAVTGADLLSLNLVGDRMDFAGQGVNEKLSGRSVFGDLIQIACGNSLPIQINTGAALIPPGTLLSVRPEDLKSLRELSHIIVIENGAAMRQWNTINLRGLGILSALFVYRGHNESARRVNEWLSSLPQSLERVGFFDFDPAGVNMGFSHPELDAVLIPDLSELSSFQREELREHCKDEAFVQQQGRINIDSLDEPGRSIMATVLKERWSLTQESMLKLKIRLKKVTRPVVA